MGLTVLEIEIGNPSNPDVTEKIDFLVDSGAIYSVVPTPVLDKLNIKPLTEQEFRLLTERRLSERRVAPCSDTRTESALRMSSLVKKETPTY